VAAFYPLINRTYILPRSRLPGSNLRDLAKAARVSRWLRAKIRASKALRNVENM
jgi:hypothetical protein